MEQSQHQKWVNLSYLALAALIGYIAYSAGTKIVGIYDLETRIRNADLVIRGISVFTFGAVFFVLYRHHQANQFMNEVMVELSRVTWPTQRETSSATVVVIVMVLVSGLLLGLMDYLLTTLLKWVL
jgi:preprotein translocase SecE subunit